MEIKLNFLGWLKKLTQPSLEKFVKANKDFIIITQTKQEVEKLHLLIWEKFEDWDAKRFSVTTCGYSCEWHWLYRDGSLSGSSGWQSLKSLRERHPELPVFNYKDIV